jgi:hypothetical protein
MTGAEIVAVSQPTFSEYMTKLEEGEWVRRIKRERSEHADSYVLLGGYLLIKMEEGKLRRGEPSQKSEKTPMIIK